MVVESANKDITKRIRLDDGRGRGRSELKLWGLGSTWRQLPRIISSIIDCRQYRHGTKKSSSFLESRGRLDELESSSMQPDFMPKARDIVTLVQHSPPQHSSYVQDALILVNFYRVNNDSSYFWAVGIFCGSAGLSSRIITNLGSLINFAWFWKQLDLLR